MMYTIIVIALLIILFILKKDSKLYTVSQVLFFLIIFSFNTNHLMNNNYNNQDYYNYYTLYISSSDSISTRNVEYGFKFLNFLSNQLSLDFYQFRLALSVFGYSLILLTLIKYTKNINYVLILYLFYPFINDAIQIRNFLAMSIVVFSFRFLVDKSIKNDVKYIVLILIATTIHNTSIFYLLFIMFRNFSKKKLFYLCTMTSMLLSLFVFTGAISSLVGFLTSFLEGMFIIDTAKVSSYFSRYTTLGLIIVIPQFLMHFISYWIISNRVVKYNFGAESTNYISTKFLDTLTKCNIIMLLTLPLIIFDFNFIRLYRNILLLNYIVFASGIRYENSFLKNGKISISLILTIGLIGYFFFIFYFRNADTQIFPVFEDNLVL